MGGSVNDTTPGPTLTILDYRAHIDRAHRVNRDLPDLKNPQDHLDDIFFFSSGHQFQMICTVRTGSKTFCDFGACHSKSWYIDTDIKRFITIWLTTTKILSRSKYRNPNSVGQTFSFVSNYLRW